MPTYGPAWLIMFHLRVARDLGLTFAREFHVRGLAKKTRGGTD